LQHTSSTQRIRRIASPSAAFEQLRVVDLVAAEFPVLARYMGENRFKAAALAFASNRPARITDQRSWLGQFPAHLQKAEPHWHFPELAELAELEFRYHVAQDIDDSQIARLGAPEVAEEQKLSLHPSVTRLLFHQNTTSLWSALQCGEIPPRPFRLDQAQHVVVWRQGSTVRFRMLGDDEAAALASFEERPSKTSPYFRNWVEAGLVVAVVK
jgi:hypothetical protein